MEENSLIAADIGNAAMFLGSKTAEEIVGIYEAFAELNLLGGLSNTIAHRFDDAASQIRDWNLNLSLEVARLLVVHPNDAIRRESFWWIRPCMDSFDEALRLMLDVLLNDNNVEIRNEIIGFLTEDIDSDDFSFTVSIKCALRLAEIKKAEREEV